MCHRSFYSAYILASPDYFIPYPSSFAEWRHTSEERDQSIATLKRIAFKDLNDILSAIPFQRYVYYEVPSPPRLQCHMV